MTTNIIDNNLTELVADNGKYITQSAEVWNERVFCKRLVLTPNETTADWRDATEKEKIEYESFTPPQKPCRTALTPMFEAAGAKFNDETGYYELNGILDIDEQEMLYTYQVTFVKPLSGSASISYANYTQKPVRTNLPANYVIHYGVVDFRCWFSTIEVLNIAPLSVKNPENTEVPWSGIFDFYSSDLKKIIGIIKFTGKNYGIERLHTLFKLTSVKFKNINKSLSFYGLRVIDLASIIYAIDNATNTTPITLEVWTDIYAKLTDPTNTEWYAVNEAAIAKNISFATTETQQDMVLSEDPSIQTVGGEMLAPAGYYLTQAKEMPIEERMFLTRKVLLPDEDMDKWRIATEAERKEQEEYFNLKLERYEENY